MTDNVALCDITYVLFDGVTFVAFLPKTLNKPRFSAQSAGLIDTSHEPVLNLLTSKLSTRAPFGWAAGNVGVTIGKEEG